MKQRDRPTIRHTCVSKQGYKVFIARDGGEALTIIDDEIPDIILLDVMMPLVDGYEVCEYVRSNKDYKKGIERPRATDRFCWRTMDHICLHDRRGREQNIFKSQEGLV